MKIIIFGRPTAAPVLVALASLASAAGAKPVWRDPKYFGESSGQFEPADAVAIDGTHPRAGEVASAYDVRGIRAALIVSTATPEQLAEILRYGFGLGLEEPEAIDLGDRCVACGLDAKVCECPQPVPIAELKYDRLKEIAASSGIDVQPNVKKVDLIALLEGAGITSALAEPATTNPTE